MRRNPPRYPPWGPGLKKVKFAGRDNSSLAVKGLTIYVFLEYKKVNLCVKYN